MRPNFKRFQGRFIISVLISFLVFYPFFQTKAQENTQQNNQSESVPEEQVSQDTSTQPDNNDSEGTEPIVNENSTEQINSNTDDDPTPFNLKPVDNIKRSLADIDAATGALTYSYPLRVPPGRRGIQPSLALAYNSQSNEEGSLFGFGWSLTIQSIERKNLNGTNKLYTSHDFTSPDGDLEYVSGQGNAIIFRSKIDNGDFNTYTLHNESTGGWWSVESKDGMTLEFGNDTDSRLSNPNDSTKVFRWNITKITDTLGNSVDYEYTKVNEQVYPDNISYTNNGVSSGEFNIEFILEDRPDDAINARPGFTVKTTKRIQKIRSFISSNLVGEYNLQYFQDEVNNRSKLSSVQFTGYDENSQSITEPATSFTYNSLGDSGFLSQITESTGGYTEFEYKPSTQYKDSSNNLLNPKLPFVVFTVSQISYNDGFGLTWENYYEYSGGWYYFNGAFDRKFVGFEKVVKIDSYGNKTISYFHQGNGNNSSYEEQNDNWGKAGKLYKIEEKNSSDSLYYRVINLWDTYDLGNNRSFVKLSQSLEQTFDGNSTHKDRATSYSYDNSNGNLVQQIEWGEVTGQSSGSFTDTGTDKYTSSITYADNSSSTIFLPSSETRIDQNSSNVSETKHYYDDLPFGQLTDGNETKTEFWQSGTNYIDTEKVYNSYGLVTLEKDALDHETSYTYDSYTLYPATITNALSQDTSYQYDYSLGKPKRIIDSNGYYFYTDYDGLDRVLAERQPDIDNPTTSVTKTSYEYVDTPNAVRVKQSNHLDSNNVVDSYTYFDGLGRKIQERSEAETSGQFNVKDFIYTQEDLLLKESLPYESSGSAKTTATTNNNLYTNYSYDALKRVTSAQTVVGTTSNVYDDWKTTVTDTKGKIKDLYKDAYDNLVQVDEHNGANTYSTYYEWNGLKKLTELTDSLNNFRNFLYDGLGRVLEAEDLHAVNDSTFGIWTYEYDEAGNLIYKTAPNAKEVEYTYDDLNRVLTEDLVGNNDVEATFEYDNCTNGIGRLCLAENSTVRIFPTYNALGQIDQEEKRIGRAYYTTNYTHDRQGNQLIIENPDASQIRYSYSNSGIVNKIERKEDTDINFSDVISSITYNPANLPTEISYASGVVTTNTYDDTELYRLRNKTTVANDKNIQDLTYTYDQVGNITEIVDDSETATAKTTNYTYDDLHRLLSATITNAAEDSPGNSVQTFTYDAIGNITYKSDVGTYSYNGNQGSSYANPHAVTTAGDYQYDYDENGNLVQVYSLMIDETKSYSWDYNNRLDSASINGVPYSYAYDTSGQRVKDISSAGTTYYITKNYSLVPNDVEKHIFLGDTAIATITGTGDTISAYNIHTDHLTGSNVITNSSQSIDELIDYYSFGSIRIDTQNGSHNEKRKHTGHMYDLGTGLTYANARYYDSTLGRWLSQDPMFLLIGMKEFSYTWNENWRRKKPDADFNLINYQPKIANDDDRLILIEFLSSPQQLNSYGYVTNNPLLYIDPTGKVKWKQLFTGTIRSIAAIGGAAISIGGVAASTVTGPGSIFVATGATYVISESGVQLSYGINEIGNAIQDKEYKAGKGILGTVVSNYLDKDKVEKAEKANIAVQAIDAVDNPNPFSFLTFGLGIYDNYSSSKSTNNSNKKTEKYEIIKKK